MCLASKSLVISKFWMSCWRTCGLIWMQEKATNPQIMVVLLILIYKPLLNTSSNLVMRVKTFWKKPDLLVVTKIHKFPWVLQVSRLSIQLSACFKIESTFLEKLEPIVWARPRNCLRAIKRLHLNINSFMSLSLTIFWNSKILSITI